MLEKCAWCAPKACAPGYVPPLAPPLARPLGTFALYDKIYFQPMMEWSDS